MTCLGPMTPDPVGKILGTGFDQFRSPSGIHGLVRVRDGTVELLAVAASHPKKGQFRAFIRLCKCEFSTIWVWHVDNAMLAKKLVEYGFRPTERREMGELMTGLRWDL